MTTGLIRDLSILGHMLDYCHDIEDAVNQYGNDINIFLNNRTYKNAVSMCIMQIGELTNKLSKEFKNDNPDIHWKEIVGMRNHFAHGYWEMNSQKIWDSVQQIPEVERLCATILEENKDLIDTNLFGITEEKTEIIDEDLEL